MNAFAALAEEQMAAPAKARARRAELRKPLTETEKKLREQSRLMAGWRFAQRQDWKEILKGPHGRQLLAFRRALRRFSTSQASEFVAFVEGQDWIRDADQVSRQTALRLVSTRVAMIREQAGLWPFDDALPGEPDCVWLRCRRAILGD